MTIPSPPLQIAASEWERRRTQALERLVRVLAFSLGTVAALGVLWALADVVLLVFAAVLLACLLRGAAEWLSARIGGRPGWWLTAIVLLAVGTVGLALWLRGPSLAGEIKQLWGQLGEQLRAVWDRLGKVEWMQPVVERARTFLDEGSQHIAGFAAGIGTKTLGSVGSFVIVLVAGIYFAIEPDLYVSGTVRLLPKPWRPRARSVMADIGYTLRWWFVGQLADMAVIGLLTGVGLYLLGVKLAVTLGAIAALCNFVPYIGALAGAVPAILVAFGEGPQTAVYVGLLFIAVQTLEGNVIAPLVQEQTVELAPVLTILSQTVLGSLFGPVGLILATPLTAAGVVAVRKVYVEGVLGDDQDREA